MKIKKSYVSISFLLLIFSLTVIGANNQSLKPQYNLETPKTSAGEITIITPENKVYTEPDSGHFPSTYGFENDQAGQAPSGWVWAAPNGYVRVLDELDGFKKVVEAHKNSGGTPTYIRKYFEQASGTTGTVEFWFQKDTLGSGADASKVHFGSPGTEHIALGFQRGDIFVGDYGYSGDWTKIADNAYVANKWYHVRIDFDLSKGWQMNFNNGTIYGAGFAFAFEGGTPSAITYFHQYTHYSADHSSYSTFHDAISYSWDPSYEIGDNLKEGLLLSYENTTNLEWKGYSLDGQDNQTILGNTTIPMPSEGHHQIQVFGNDSLGIRYASELRFFQIDIDPVDISIISPINNEIFQDIAPDFEIFIDDPDLNASWYSLDGGITNIIFTGFTGIIEQSEWNKFSNGTVTIEFYANNSLNNIGYASVIVRKDVMGPIITVNSPQDDDVFGINAPNYDISIIESNLDSYWYTIDDGATNITISSFTGSIDQTEWGKKGGGTVLIRFYANDSFGNVDFSEVIVVKDLISPIVSINLPFLNEVFGIIPPNFDIAVIEVNPDLMWYTLDSGVTNITFGSLTGAIDQTEWDKQGNGTVTVKFYARDEGGNEGFAVVIVRKDIDTPLITINFPITDDTFGFHSPLYDIYVEEFNLDSMWYTIDNGLTNIPITSTVGTIDQTEWDKFGNGTVTITFYANDSINNIGQALVKVQKDVLGPIITINLPQDDDVFGFNPPNYDLSIEEFNLDSMWYTLDNGLTFIPITSTVGTIDQTEWDKRGGGTIAIRFYANDTLGNTGYSEVIIIKDIITPAISINSPNTFDVFGMISPSFDLSVVEPNLDSMWYSLDDGSTIVGINSLSGTIQQAEWNKFGNGTVTIQFYAMDLAGNIGVNQITVRKDVSLPTIAILSPEMREFIGPNAPHFELSIQEPNIDTMWYTLDYGTTNFYFDTFTGVIDQLEWNKHGNGSVVIQFYVRDKGGNEAFSEVLINKDIYAPIITIESPEIGDQILDYSPIFSVSIQEPNLDDFWYSLDNGTTNITVSEFTGIVDQVEWDTLPNGPVIIRFYAQDEAGNIGVASVIVTKLTTYIEPPPGIPGYDLIALIAISSIITLILLRKKFKK